LFQAFFRILLEQQQINIEFYCQPENFNLEIVDTFNFHGITGTVVQKTPEFQRMLKRLASPDIAGVVVSDITRMMRVDELDAFSALKMFRTGKKLIWCEMSRPLDITVPEDRSLLANKLLEAGNERRKIVFRTQRKKEQLILDPEINMCKLPNGVEHIKNIAKYGHGTKKGFYQYTKPSEKIKKAFELVAGGETLYQVAKRLGFSSGMYLRYVLANRWWLGIKERTHQVKYTYNEETGNLERGKRQAHPKPIIQETNLAKTPLVSVEVFNRVQNLISVRRTKWSQVVSNTDSFLGTGFLHCECGAKMYLKNDTRQGQPPVYICSSWRLAKIKKPCGAKRLRAAVIDAAISKAAYKYFNDRAWLTAALEKASHDTEATKRHDAVVVAENTLKDLETQSKRYSRLYVANEDEESFAMVRKLKGEISGQKIRLATAQAEASPFGTDEPGLIAATIVQRFAEFPKMTMAEKRECLADVLDKITINQDGTASFTVKGGMPIATGDIDLASVAFLQSTPQDGAMQWDAVELLYEALPDSKKLAQYAHAKLQKLS
jgi:hypothetical protein